MQMFQFARNTFPDTVNSKVLLLKQEHFKDTFRLKSEKKKKNIKAERKLWCC